MSVSVIVTDCVMLNCTKKKKLYLQMIQLNETKIKDNVVDVDGTEVDLLKQSNNHHEDDPTCRI